MNDIETRRAQRQERAARTPGYCQRCGYAGTNVRHDTAEERAGDEYHRTTDVPFCDFLPGGPEPDCGKLP